MIWTKQGISRKGTVRRTAFRILTTGLAVLVANASSIAATYDLSRDFSPTNNPAGVWTYGAKPSFDGSFLTFTVRGLNPFEYWQLVPSQEPTIYRNGTSETITLGGSQGVYPPGTVLLYSGTDGASNGYGVARFTVPAGGSSHYLVQAAVRPVYDGNLQGDTDFHVVKNGAEVFGRFLAPAGSSGYTNTLSLVTGDTLDFMIGRGQDNSGTTSGLKINVAITPTSTPPRTGFVVNNSFELGTDPGISADVSAPNSTTITGWTVEAASVDYIGSRWTAGDGVRCLDLSGTDAGTISQTITGLTSGQVYRLSFLMAGNPEVGLTLARLRAQVGATAQEFSFSPSGFAPVNMGWTEKTMDFVAGASSEKLSFVSLNPGWAGAALDRVAIEASTNTPPPPPPPQLTYNVGRDFSLANPNGVWSYGYQSAIGGQFNLLNSQQTVQGENGAPILLWHFQTAPAIYGNTNDTVAVTGGEPYPAHSAWAYAGPEGSDRTFAVIRFTTPANGAGLYAIASAVSPRISGGGDDSDFHVAKNGVEVFGQFLGAMESGGYTNSLELQAGDTIDFLVGRGANGRLAGSGLKILATIGLQTNTPPPPPPAGLVANGSFELGTHPGISTDVSAPNSTTITGWTVEMASVDYIGSRWVAGDGVRCLDLSGTDAGTISQLISGLTPGQAYRLSFVMAANPEVGSFTARLRAEIGGVSQEFSFLQSGFSTANLGWTEKTVDFIASSSSHKLSFTSLNPGWAGAALDKISVEALTPPAALVANGSFELGIDPGISADVSAPNSTTITDWTVETASVDYIGSRWIAGDGVRCLDLSGTDAGTISQQIEGLTPGQHYRLSFLMAGNPEVGLLRARLRASIGDASEEFEFLQSSTSTAHLGWLSNRLDFTAGASSHKLSFTSLNPGWAGAALDRVAIVAVTNVPPQPPGLVANWSFELGTDPGISTDVSAPNSTTITGWTVEAASVDYIGTRWTAGDGVRCLDLSGTDAGTISQVINGLTPGQHYRLSFLMAANPEVGAITARLRASIGGASQEFSFLQSSFSTANLGWTEKSLIFTASGSSQKLTFTSLNPGWAGAALDKVSINVSTNPPPPANHAPVAKAMVEPLFNLWADETNLLVIAGNGNGAELNLDGSLSSDEDGGALEYLWLEEGQPFASGVAATNTFELGEHTIHLVVDDGQATGLDVVTVEVITLGEAVEELLLFVTETDLARKEKRPLLATLNRVLDSFDEGRLGAGIKQLGAFQQKIRMHLLNVKSSAGRKLIDAADQIIDAANAVTDDDGDPKHSSRGKQGG